MAFRNERDVRNLALDPGKSETYHFDALRTALAVRLQATGKPAYVVWYTVAGRRKKLSLGPIDSMSLEEARDRARDIRKDARLDGVDAVAKRKADKAAAAVWAYTVKSLIADYLTEYAEPRLRPRTVVETRRALNVHWAPLHAKPVDEVTRRDVSDRVLQLARNSGVVAANRARASLSALYTWGMRADRVKLDHNPVNNALMGGDETPRERVLTVEELRSLWRWAEDDGGRYAKIVMLLILLGVRREELASMTWAELDLEAGVWHLPSTKTKTGNGRDVQLSKQAVAIFDSLPRSGDYVFAGRQGRKFAGFAWNKKRLDKAVSISIAVGWRLHDLRRSTATGLADQLGVAPHVVSGILGHAASGQNPITAIYNKSQYAREQRTALQEWADFITKSNNDNVLQLAAARVKQV
jgi:integrase